MLCQKLKKRILEEDVFDDNCDDNISGNVKSISQTANRTLLGNVKEMTDAFFLYDKKGNKIEKFYNQDNELTSKSIYKNNKRGYRICENHYDYEEGSEFNKTYEYKFDKFGNLVKICKYIENDLNEYYVYGYDKRGVLIEKIAYFDEETFFKESYHYNGNGFEVKGMDADGKKKYNYHINKETRVEEKIFFNLEGEIENKLVLKYDELGNTIARKSVYPNVCVDYDVIDENELDYNNNLIKIRTYRIENNVKVLDSIIERKILYY